MVDTIYTGVDCCEDAERKGWDIHATPGVVWATKGQRIDLRAVKISRECDPGCIYWRIIAGGGFLFGEFGDTVTYVAADENKDCAGSALIGMFCGGELRDTVRVAINEYVGDETAYYTVTKWYDNYYPGPVLAGDRVTDPEYGITTVVYKPTEAVIRYFPDKEYYGDTKPNVSTVYVTGRKCNGKRTTRTFLSIRNRASVDREGKIVLRESMWIAINPSSLHLSELYKGHYTFEQAKQASLDGFAGVSIRAYIPTQYSIPPRLSANPTFEERETYEKTKILFDLWMDYAKRVRQITLKEGEAADIRNPAMIKGSCCSPYLI